MIHHSSSAYALITGGGHGIGAEFAELLAEKGWDLILVGRNNDRLQQTASNLGSTYGREVLTAVHDLSAPEETEKLHRWCGERNLRVELLINNAGFGLFGPSVTQQLSEVESMLGLNVTSLTLLSDLFAADMAERGSGAVLNVGSLAGRSPMPNFAAYGASKSYVRTFSLALRAELAGTGVTVTCLEPGYVRTSFDDNAKIRSRRYRAFSRKSGMEPGAGLKAVMKGRAVAVPGLMNRLIVLISSLVPEPIAAAVIGKAVRALASDEEGSDAVNA
jgi:hypothetical protein